MGVVTLNFPSQPLFIVLSQGFLRYRSEATVIKVKWSSGYRWIPVLTRFNHRVKNNQQFTHAGGEGDLFHFAFGQQALIEFFNDWIMANG